MDFNKITAISLLCLFSIAGCDSPTNTTEQAVDQNSIRVTTDKNHLTIFVLICW